MMKYSDNYEEANKDRKRMCFESIQTLAKFIMVAMGKLLENNQTIALSSSGNCILFWKLWQQSPHSLHLDQRC
jgi:hypothetical protein